MRVQHGRKVAKRLWSVAGTVQQQNGRSVGSFVDEPFGADDDAVRSDRVLSETRLHGAQVVRSPPRPDHDRENERSDQWHFILLA